MKHQLLSVFLLDYLLQAVSRCNDPTSEFHLEGDYLIGGLFEVHNFRRSMTLDKPEAVDCSSQPFSLTDYRRLQMMRFSVEEINNSTSLLPNVSLGYEIFDHCSETHSFPAIFNLISVNDSIRPWADPQTQHRHKPTVPKVISVVGPLTSNRALAVAPLIMMDLIPMVNYGATTSAFSEKMIYPSFLRTVHPNKTMIEVIVQILLHFNWRWVAFLHSDDNYGSDGQDLFIKRIKDTEICLAYTKELGQNTNDSYVLAQIDSQNIHIIIVFAPESYVEMLIGSAIELNVTKKVWVAVEAWSLNKKLPKERGVQNIGTVLGIAEPTETIAGFDEFVFSLEDQRYRGNQDRQFCHQICNCSDLNPKEIIDADPSYTFRIYSALYAIAHALHNTLRCGSGKCQRNITVEPYMVLAELRKSNFTLLNQTIHFDDDGDPEFGSYSIIFWNQSGDTEAVGFFQSQPSATLFINNSKIKWYTNGEAPTSVCSKECPVGHVKHQDGTHQCCFYCQVCPNGTYINSTVDPTHCVKCNSETEWSGKGSTSCHLRSVEFVPFTEGGAVLHLVATGAFISLCAAVSVLFAVNYHTPVVRSAGGPLCFLVLSCLCLSSTSVVFFFGRPSSSFCIMRSLMFVVFFTPCLAAFAVRSFQIVCIFKIAAKHPMLQSCWLKHHGQWLFITVASSTQVLLVMIEYLQAPPKPFNDTTWEFNKIVLKCDMNLNATSASVLLIVSLCFFCFIFSYMGKDLPKNYNEAKAITWCLTLLVLTWIISATAYTLYHGKHIQTLNAMALLSSLYSFLLWYFLPKCYIIIFQPHKNTQQYFQGLIQSYTKTISQ